MNRTTVYVQKDIITIVFILVNHQKFPFLTLHENKQRRCRCSSIHIISSTHILSLVLAALVAYGTGCLASGLTGCLALAASALFHGILQGLRI